ncbi:MAG: tetratricopeptide repeat protein, partial [Myxococcota bacterium]
RVIGNLGALAHDVGEFDEALAYYEDSLKALRRARETRVEAVFLTNLGLLRQELGAFDEAIEDFSVALDLLNRTPDPRLEAVARTNRGMLFLALDDRVKAQADQEAAVRLFSESADHREMALASIRLGATQALAGDRFGARRAIDAAERVLGPSDDALAIELVELGRAFMDLQLAVSAHQLGDSDDTVRHLGVAERKLLAALNEENAALFDVFFDARILASLLRTRIEALGAHGEEDALIVAADAQRFRPPGGSWQDFGRKQSAKGILAALVSRHGSSPVEPLTVDDLFRAGWGDQNIQNDSKANRVYVALSDLRKKGLRTLIRRTEAGYFLDPSVPVVRVDR